MTSANPPPKPPVEDLQASLDALERANGLDPERGRAAVERGIALGHLLSHESLEHLAKLSADDRRAEIAKAGLDPQKVDDTIERVIAHWRATSPAQSDADR
jgi:hypothetical protein